MAEEKHHHHFHHEDKSGYVEEVDYRKEEKHHKHLEHLGELGTAAAGVYAMVIIFFLIFCYLFFINDFFFKLIFIEVNKQKKHQMLFLKISKLLNSCTNCIS